MKRFILWFLSIAVVLSAVSCGGDSARLQETSAALQPNDEESDIIRIGVYEPITGVYAEGGNMEVEGLLLANRMFPEALGKRIELVLVDNKSDIEESVNAVRTLIHSEHVVAVIGSWGSSLSMAAAPTIESARIPAVGITCTNPLVTMDNDYYFRVCYTDDFQGYVLADYAYHVLGARKIALVAEFSNDYSIGLTGYFAEAFREISGDADCVAATVYYSSGDTDFSIPIQTISVAKPDVIFAPGNHTECALLIRQAVDLGIDAPFLGGDTWESPGFLSLGGSAIEGVIFSAFSDLSEMATRSTNRFVEAFVDMYDKQPTAASALAYDAYRLIRHAIEKSGSLDPAVLSATLRDTRDFLGVAGIISLDEDGDAIKPAAIKTVRNGRFVYQTTVHP